MLSPEKSGLDDEVVLIAGYGTTGATFRTARAIGYGLSQSKQGHMVAIDDYNLRFLLLATSAGERHRSPWHGKETSQLVTEGSHGIVGSRQRELPPDFITQHDEKRGVSPFGNEASRPLRRRFMLIAGGNGQSNVGFPDDGLRQGGYVSRASSAEDLHLVDAEEARPAIAQHVEKPLSARLDSHA